MQAWQDGRFPPLKEMNAHQDITIGTQRSSEAVVDLPLLGPVLHDDDQLPQPVVDLHVVLHHLCVYNPQYGVHCHVHLWLATGPSISTLLTTQCDGRKSAFSECKKGDRSLTHNARRPGARRSVRDALNTTWRGQLFQNIPSDGSRSKSTTARSWTSY